MGSELTSNPAGSGSIEDRTGGFTLIELMVVVAVLSVLAVGAGLVASRSGKSAATTDLQRFERHIQTARARAMQGRQVRGLFVTTQGFQPSVETVDGWDKSQPEIRWRGGVTLQLATPRQGHKSPHIVLLPDGRVSPFTLSFAPDGSHRIVCRSDGNAGMSCDQG